MKMKEYEQKENQIIERLTEIEMKLNQALNKQEIMEHVGHFCQLMEERIQALTKEQSNKS